MERLRRECPWDAEQTHRSLVRYLVEETCEVVEAIEDGSDTDLREELGDLLLQVVFHATIAAERGAFTLDEVAAGVADKLVARHPYVFADGDVPDDLDATWEQRKRAEKQRTSALDGIPSQLSALTRAAKTISRARSHAVDLPLPAEPVEADVLGSELLALAARAQASGLDPEQVLRDSLRTLEGDIRRRESPVPATDGSAS
ncbi:nucleoside triphosphate pyrophosphohydrolase [Desertihabitans brevis]|uniref:Nucleoside triphosphate pyrophosphohydrolase n=1 Tax=Desertihabitans brevis TaxID=2268447 RepID=A0A367YYC2_9ACTN|nr:MazG family protein [Desertihabitans brevis]RCK70905.1 nucleoside triphosphate pyrophosphohydrolase [Desertihabitans brevis]